MLRCARQSMKIYENWNNTLNQEQKQNLKTKHSVFRF